MVGILMILLAVALVGVLSSVFGVDHMFVAILDTFRGGVTGTVNFLEKQYNKHGVPMLRRLAYVCIGIMVVLTLGTIFLMEGMKEFVSIVLPTTFIAVMFSLALAWHANRGPKGTPATAPGVAPVNKPLMPFLLISTAILGVTVTGLTIMFATGSVGDTVPFANFEAKNHLRSLVMLGSLGVFAGFAIAATFAMIVGYLLKEVGEAIEGTLDITLSALAKAVSEYKEHFEAIQKKISKTVDITPDQYIFPALSIGKKSLILWFYPFFAVLLSSMSLYATSLFMSFTIVGYLGVVGMELAGVTADKTKAMIMTGAVLVYVVTTLLFVPALIALFSADVSMALMNTWDAITKIFVTMLSGDNMKLVAGVVVLFASAFAFWAVGQKTSFAPIGSTLAVVFSVIGLCALSALVYNMTESRVLAEINSVSWYGKSLDTLKPNLVDNAGSSVLVTWKQKNDRAGQYDHYRVERRIEGDVANVVVLSDAIRGDLTSIKDDLAGLALTDVDLVYRLSGFEDGRWIPGPETRVKHWRVAPLPPPAPVPVAPSPTATESHPSPKPPAPGLTPPPQRTVSNADAGCGNLLQQTASLCDLVGGHCK